MFKNNQENPKIRALKKVNLQCYPLKSISLQDASLMPFQYIKKITTTYFDKCLNAEIIAEIISQIQSFYHQNGYIAAHVLIKKQNIQNGNLELKIYEGKIGELILGSNKFTDKMQKITAFGLIEGEVLDLNDINQGIYQMNRLSSNNAAMKIVPSSREGYANVFIENQPRFPVSAKVSYDNLGNEFTGIY